MTAYEWIITWGVAFDISSLPFLILWLGPKRWGLRIVESERWWVLIPLFMFLPLAVLICGIVAAIRSH